MTLPFRDRHGAASQHHINRAATIVLMCDVHTIPDRASVSLNSEILYAVQDTIGSLSNNDEVRVDVFPFRR